jgi:hypothetical protein
LTEAVRTEALIVEMRQVNGKPTPVGVMNRAFDGKPAVIIHLGDFSLWVTSKYVEEAVFLPCVKKPESHLTSLYTKDKIDLSQY